jgi:hypothetical protein
MTVRKIIFRDCVFDIPQGPIPSSQIDAIFENCLFKGSIGPDKQVVNYIFKNCYLEGIALQSDNITSFIFQNSTCHSINGTVRTNILRASRIDTFGIGTIGQGVTESVIIEDCEIGQIVAALTFQMPGGGGPAAQFNACINNFAFSGGTLSQPMPTTFSNF